MRFRIRRANPHFRDSTISKKEIFATSHTVHILRFEAPQQETKPNTAQDDGF
jgi:hypothetical protein